MASDPQPVAAGLESPPGKRPASLRARLMVYAALALVVSLGLVGLALDAAFQRSNETDLRNQMETWVYLVLAATEVAQDGSLQVSADLGDPLLSQPASGIYVHVHGTRDHWNSPSSLGMELPEPSQAAAGQALFSAPADGEDYFTFQYGVAWELPDESVLPFTVSVLVDPLHLQPQISAFRAGLWKSLGAAGLILAMAQLLFFRLGLSPLGQVATDVANIESGRAESLQGPYPRELEPLTRNLDRLLKTEKANQARYRNALDSLAHSLKTPLAVIRAGLGSGGDTAAIDKAVDEMQYLITSRLERAAASTRRTLSKPVPVLPQAERLLNSLLKVYSHKMKKSDVKIEGALAFYGEERDLLEIMGNLLDNACKYGDGSVRLSAGVIEKDTLRPGLWIRVENDGGKISGEQRERLLQRGARGDERAHEFVEGHGLGLTIVSEVVNAYGGVMTIGDSDLGGASITVTLPPGG